MKKRLMKGERMDYVAGKICRTQANIYKYVAKLGYRADMFSDAFLKSTFCEEAFDTKYSRYQFETPMECMDFILPEIGGRLEKTTEKQDEDMAGFVGYMYRYLYFVTPYTSKKLLEKVPYADIAKYISSATVEGLDLAAEDICEDCSLEFDAGIYKDKTR